MNSPKSENQENNSPLGTPRTETQREFLQKAKQQTVALRLILAIEQEILRQRRPKEKRSHITKRGILHSLQRAYDLFPTELIDLPRQKTAITNIPLKPGTIGYNARILSVLIKGGLLYEGISHGKEMIDSAKNALSELFLHGELPEDENIHLFLTMGLLVLGVIVYYGIIKKDDLQQERKKTLREFYYHKERKRQ